MVKGKAAYTYTEVLMSDQESNGQIVQDKKIVEVRDGEGKNAAIATIETKQQQTKPHEQQSFAGREAEYAKEQERPDKEQSQ